MNFFAILFPFFFVLFHCQQTFISISIDNNEIQFKGSGVFTNFDQIRELFFLSKDYKLNSQYYRHRELSHVLSFDSKENVPNYDERKAILKENTPHCKNNCISIDTNHPTNTFFFAEGKDLIGAFDSMAVLAAFNYFGLDFDGKSQFVTGAVYDLVGFDQFHTPVNGKVIGEPILVKGKTLTVHVYLRPHDQIDSSDFKPTISGKFLMVKKGVGEDLKVPAGSPHVKEGNEFKTLKERFEVNESRASPSGPISSFKPSVTNIYNTVFGGYLMNAAYKIAENEFNWGALRHEIVLEVGLFMNPVSPNETVNAYTRTSKNAICVYFVDSDREPYCKFLFSIK